MQEVELAIESIGYEGIGIARHDGVVNFVKNVVPGDRILALQRKRYKSYISCDLIKVLEPSKDRIEAKCSHFGNCGGCSWQNIGYKEQLKWKKIHVADSFQRLGGVTPNVIYDTLASPIEFHFRNKMEFSFSSQRWLSKEEIEGEGIIENKTFALGLHAPGRFDKAIDIKECFITPSVWNDILEFTRRIAIKNEIRARNELQRTGFLRNLILRRSGKTGEIMLILITDAPSNQSEYSFIVKYTEEISREFPQISTIIHVINSTLSQVAIEELRVLTGKGFLCDSIMGLDFKVSPYAFFQTNSELLDVFIKTIIDSAELKPEQTIWDLYCGAGSITLPASKHCKEIIGFENNYTSIEDAKTNALLNNINNATFFEVDLNTRKLSEDLTDLSKPDTIIADPPRIGMHKRMIEQILEIAPERIVYVSCNPATQARDCSLLNEKYSVLSAQPVDMFPQTYHIENIAVLERKRDV